MTDDIWQRETVESPCIKLCIVHPETRLCIGCYRSIDEIAAWSTMTPAARRSVIVELPGRAHLVKPERRGGRRGRE